MSCLLLTHWNMIMWTDLGFIWNKLSNRPCFYHVLTFVFSDTITSGQPWPLLFGFHRDLSQTYISSHYTLHSDEHSVCRCLCDPHILLNEQTNVMVLIIAGVIVCNTAKYKYLVLTCSHNMSYNNHVRSKNRGLVHKHEYFKKPLFFVLFLQSLVVRPQKNAVYDN